MSLINLFYRNSHHDKLTHSLRGHYVPIILDNISDESVLDIEKRKYYIQNYTFTMLGFLIDEDEFEIVPCYNKSFNYV